MEKWLEEIKEHFSYCIDEGLTIGEQEEKLLESLYQNFEKLYKENQWLYGKLGQIDLIIESGRREAKHFD